jgi:predicted TIM-barrel fold metal-dependent hydrolase
VSGPLEHVLAWKDADPERFVAATFVGHSRPIEELDFGPPLTAERLRREYDANRLSGMGEIVAQYTGIAPSDARLEPFFALAAELDLPVLIHMGGLGAPSKSFRSAVGNPLLLEDVVARYPGLRIYIENAGYPFLSETIALMTQYPQVYADLSTVLRIIPVEEFHEFLRSLLRAGLSARLMFGSDGGVWPQAITHAVQTIESVPFLSELQKRDLFYNNAARFLRLTDEEIARHHRR